MARLFEKLVHDQLLNHLDRYLYSTDIFIDIYLYILYRYLCSSQSGFRPKHSTETSLLNTTNKLFLNIDRGQYDIAVIIDLRKAFDTV